MHILKFYKYFDIDQLKQLTVKIRHSVRFIYIAE